MAEEEQKRKNGGKRSPSTGPRQPQSVCAGEGGLHSRPSGSCGHAPPRPLASCEGRLGGAPESFRIPSMVRRSQGWGVPRRQTERTQTRLKRW